MPKIHSSQIVVKEDRQRKEFKPEKLEELRESILSRGLMHPPVLRNEDGKMVLVAGERRLRVMRDIYDLEGSFSFGTELMTEGMIPYTDFGTLDPLEAEELELDENLKRDNLTWQEHAAAVQKLHNLRDKQRQAARQLNPEVVIPPQTAADTAREVYPEATAGKSSGELGHYQATTRKELIVANHLDNPEVAKAKDLKQAMKILKTQEARENNRALALSVGASFKTEMHTILNMDAVAFLRNQLQVPDSPRYNVILTDPPYGMDAQDFGDAGGKMTAIEHKYEDGYEFWQKLMREWCPLSYQIAAPQAHAYVFCDIDNFAELRSMMKEAGWDVFRTPLILYKLNSGRVPRPEHGPRRQWEMILYAIKGNKQVNAIYSDVLAAKGDDNLGHGAQKPVEAFQNLLMRSVQPGDRILDTFAGTGTLLPAVHPLKCYATVVEKDPANYGICLKRLQMLKEIELGSGLSMGE